MGLNKSRVVHYAFWFWLIMVVMLSVIPRTPRSRVIAWGLEFRIDYLEHLVVYFVLGVLYVSNNRKVVSKTYILKVLHIFMWMIFATAMELVQKYIAGRSFNPNDMYYNVAGIVLGLVTAVAYFQKQENKDAR